MNRVTLPVGVGYGAAVVVGAAVASEVVGAALGGEIVVAGVGAAVTAAAVGVVGEVEEVAEVEERLVFLLGTGVGMLLGTTFTNPLQA